MGKIDWDVITNYTDAVTTSLKTVSFPKVQEQVYLRNQGNANLTYTIGSKSGTLTPGQSVTVTEDVSSYSIQAATGTHTFELRAKEKGTEIEEVEASANHTHNNKGVLDQLSDNNGTLQYKGSPIQSGNSGSGGGSLVYATLAALQAAYPNGTTQPAWVIADNSWYYWSGTVTPPADTTPPSNVTGVNASSVTQTSMTIGWTAVSDAVSYEVWRNSSLVTTVSTTSYNATGLTAGTSYSWVIKAKDAAGNTASGSTPLVQSTLAADVTPPADTTPPIVTASPAPGTYTSAQNVQLSTEAGATIYYTTNGQTPTTSSTIYNGLIPINATTTLQYIGKDAAGNISTPVAATYTINIAATPTTIVSDSFTRADSTTTLGSAETGGQTWTALKGVWGINTNQAYLTANLVESLAVVDSGYSDVTVQAKFNVLQASNTRLIFRAVDSNNLLLVQTEGGTNYKLYKRVGGTYTQIGAKVQTPVNGDIIKVVASGTNITVYVNGTSIITAANVTDNQTATKHGFGTGNSADRIDDFSITTP